MFYRVTDENKIEEVYGDGWIEEAVNNDWLLFDSIEDAEKWRDQNVD